MKKICVVIRHLPNSDPVASTVIESSTDVDQSFCQENYLRSEAQDHIDVMKTKFPEFKQAQFYINIINI